MTDVVFSLNDESLETSTHTVKTAVLTAVNFDAENTLVTTLKTALIAITIGTLYRDSRASIIATSPVKPGDLFAQRELKLLVRYQGDITGKYYTLEIATPDLTNLTQEGNTDFVVLADGGIMAAWVTGFEAVAKAPDDLTETITTISAQIVGRNI